MYAFILLCALAPWYTLPMESQKTQELIKLINNSTTINLRLADPSLTPRYAYEILLAAGFEIPLVGPNIPSTSLLQKAYKWEFEDLTRFFTEEEIKEIRNQVRRERLSGYNQ